MNELEKWFNDERCIKNVEGSDGTQEKNAETCEAGNFQWETELKCATIRRNKKQFWGFSDDPLKQIVRWESSCEVNLRIFTPTFRQVLSRTKHSPMHQGCTQH